MYNKSRNQNLGVSAFLKKCDKIRYFQKMQVTLTVVSIIIYALAILIDCLLIKIPNSVALLIVTIPMASLFYVGDIKLYPLLDNKID